MWLAVDWLVKFPFQKLLVLYMAEGRNCPVIQEIREQPCDLERRVSVRHPVHLRLRSFLVFSSPLMDRHTSFIAFSALWSSHCGHTFSCFLSALQHYLLYIILYTKGPVISEGNFKESLVFFPTGFYLCVWERACLWLIKPLQLKPHHGLGVYWQALQKDALTGAVHTHTHHTNTHNSIELWFVMSI